MRSLRISSATEGPVNAPTDLVTNEPIPINGMRCNWGGSPTNSSVPHPLFFFGEGDTPGQPPIETPKKNPQKKIETLTKIPVPRRNIFPLFKS